MKRPEQEPPDITPFEAQFGEAFPPVKRGMKPHSGTWAETFETLGIMLIIAVILLGLFAVCGYGLWIAGHHR